MLIFDIETDGLLDEVTKVHVVGIRETQHTNLPARGVNGAGIKDVVDYIASSHDVVVGHNIIKFDIPVLQKLYPGFDIQHHRIRDTLVMSRLIYPDISDIDTKLVAEGKLTPKNFNSHSLAAWGERLGNKKADYTGGWAEWSQEMQDYCVQDISTTESLMNKLLEKNYSPRAIELEHKVAYIVARQERHGFLFDQQAAAALYSKLVKRKIELETELRDSIAPLYVKSGALMPKKDDIKKGYCAGAAHTKVTQVQFNPGSRDHIAKVLKCRRGWKPTEFTDGGKPKIDETVLSKLNYPEAKPLSEYFLVSKRLSQLAEGGEAWLKRVGKDGRIHGGVITNGAVTGRMTHSKPNMAQIPAGYSPYGLECRACFKVPEGKALVGIDAAALELRCLAGYMARFDGGAYVNTVVNGKKEDGTEIHTVNRKALGIESRDVAKTWFYGFVYGAGEEKLGAILGFKLGNAARKAGKESRAKFMAGLPALSELVSRVKAKVKTAGHLVGLDGRILHIRSEHSALNTLLQSAGAVLMKQALVNLDEALIAAGYLPGVNYEFVVNCHDEWQIECDEGIADEIGQAGVAAIRKAGEDFSFNCPLDGEYKVGKNWAMTH